MVARSSCEKVVAFMSVFMTVLTLRECCCTDRSERSGENVNLKMKAVNAETWESVPGISCEKDLGWWIKKTVLWERWSCSGNDVCVRVLWERWSCSTWKCKTVLWERTLHLECVSVLLKYCHVRIGLAAGMNECDCLVRKILYWECVWDSCEKGSCSWNVRVCFEKAVLWESSAVAMMCVRVLWERVLQWKCVFLKTVLWGRSCGGNVWVCARQSCEKGSCSVNVLW